MFHYNYKACFIQPKCFDESLAYFSFFVLLCFIEMNLTYFVVFFPSGTLFFMRTVCGFQINAVVWIAPEPTSLSSEEKCAGSISLLVFL